MENDAPDTGPPRLHQPPQIRGAMAGSRDLFSEAGLRTRDELRRALSHGGPIALEIGFGHGRFLTGMARQHPSVQFVGIEIQQRWLRSAQALAEKQQLDNVMVIKADARVLLCLDFPPSSVDHIFVLFPDPWWKQKHRRKRRMITPEFLDLASRVLRVEGSLTLKTDVEAYMQSSRAMIDAHPHFRPREEAGLAIEAEVITKRERRCALRGEAVYARYWSRHAPSPKDR